MYMSVGNTSCHCGPTFQPGASEEVEKQILKNAIQNFELFTPSAFKIEKCCRAEINMVQAKKHKNMAKSRTL